MHKDGMPTKNNERLLKLTFKIMKTASEFSTK